MSHAARADMPLAVFAEQEIDLTDQPIDPAATPEADDAPQIAADDVGASAFAETLGRRAQRADSGIDDEDGTDRGVPDRSSD